MGEWGHIQEQQVRGPELAGLLRNVLDTLSHSEASEDRG